ncbi:MAG: CoA transferase subunit A [Desulfitobacteriaceae bacterium]
MSKLMHLDKAVGTYLKDGCSVSFGGLAAREPMAVTHEIIRQGFKEMTFITAVTTDTANLLLGAGCLKKLEMSYVWIGIVGSGLNLRRAVERGIPNHVEVEEYSNYGASLRFLAGAMDIPFMPTRTMLGSDMPEHNPNIKLIESPYSGEKLVVVPAANPDVAFIHVQKADAEGNAQIWGNSVNDLNIARAAKKLVITCEELVSTDEIRKMPNMTAIPGYCVSAVVQISFGSHPMPVAGLYAMDVPFRRQFMKYNQTHEGFLEWLHEWVYTVKDHQAYLEKVGYSRLEKLRELEVGERFLG